MNYRRLAAFVLISLVIGSAVFAQNRGALTIQCDQIGAQVFLNNRLAGTTTPSFSQLLAAGIYSIRVTKAGFKNYETTITMTGGPVVLNVTLESLVVTKYRLTINAQTALGVQVPGAQVYINNSLLGSAPVASDLEAGNYSLSIEAPHYERYTASINLNSNTIHSATMSPQRYLLSISAWNANTAVPNASVTVNGTPLGLAPVKASVETGNYNIAITAPDFEPYQAVVTVTADSNHAAAMKMLVYRLSVSANAVGAELYLNEVFAGSLPYVTNLTPGSYNLTVKAAGYKPYTAPLVMNGAKNLNVSLVMLPAQIQVKMPSQFLNRGLNNPEGQVDLYIDGVKQDLKLVETTAGRRLLRLSSGGLAVEAYFDLKPGVLYTLEPELKLNLK